MFAFHVQVLPSKAVSHILQAQRASLELLLRKASLKLFYLNLIFRF